MSDGAKLAVDIGGTFTDLVLEKGDERHQAKLLTTPAAPEEAVLEGTKRILAESNTPLDAVELVIHGTTLATNALIETRGRCVTSGDSQRPGVLEPLRTPRAYQGILLRAKIKGHLGRKGSRWWERIMLVEKDYVCGE